MSHTSADHLTMSMDMDMDMSSSSSSSSCHSMGLMSMNMWLTTQYKNYPILFELLSASNGGQAFGIFVLVFVASFLSKGFEFAKNYLEQRVWKNPNYQVTTIVENCECDDTEKGYSTGGSAHSGPKGLSVFSIMARDLTRIILCFLSEMLGYAMMLVAMSFSLVYFFGVVLGMALGRFFFERLSDKMNLRPGSNNFSGHH